MKVYGMEWGQYRDEHGEGNIRFICCKIKIPKRPKKKKEGKIIVVVIKHITLKTLSQNFHLKSRYVALSSLNLLVV